MHTELHRLLERQLMHLELDSENPPSDPIKWQGFIEKVNKVYMEADQERYLLERSMELSSQELLDLNKRLETAQHIAHLGYWLYNRSKEEIILSKELYNILGLNQDIPVPSFADFMENIDEEHRPHLEELTDRAFAEELDYEYEFHLDYLFPHLILNLD